MPRYFSRVCKCPACRRRDAATFADIVDASYAARERSALERRADAATVDSLERAYMAPAASARAGAGMVRDV